MKKTTPPPLLSFLPCCLLLLFYNINGYAQTGSSAITVRSALAGGVVYMLDCENGFGGGNIAASVGPDGILLADDMFKDMHPQLLTALNKLSDSSIRIVVNTHYHRDHIEGNSLLSRSAVIIAHKNVLTRLMMKGSWASAAAYPAVTFSDTLTIHFNGEEILLFHLPDGHTDGDVYAYFKTSNVIHMGDTFFNGMFPGVYTEGGGDILHLITNLEQVLHSIPDNIKIIPGHGALAGKTDLRNYIAMLKETTAIVSAGIKAGKSLQQLQNGNVLQKYDALGQGGAQTTSQYLAMLYKLLSK
jgi:cyclase